MEKWGKPKGCRCRRRERHDPLGRALRLRPSSRPGLRQQGQRNKERARELAEASLFKAELELTKFDYDGVQRTIKQAIDFDYQWWSPHNRTGKLLMERAQWNAVEKEFWKRRGLLRRSKTRQRFLATWRNCCRPRTGWGRQSPLMRVICRAQWHRLSRN
jgi:hypothetical protein